MTPMIKSLYHFLYQNSIVWKIALASALSWEVAQLIGSSHPYLAPLSVILCLQITVGKSVIYGFQRVLGTIAGVVFTTYLTPYIGMNAWSLGLMILVASLITRWMGFDKIVINQVALSILLVLSFQSHSSYGFDRIRDTFIGCAIAVVTNMILMPPNFTGKAIQEVMTYMDCLANDFKNAGKWLKSNVKETEEDVLKNSEILTKDLKKAMDKMDLAESSIRYNPFIRRSQTELGRYKKQMMFLYQGSAHLSNILQTIYDWKKDGDLTKEERQFWANRMNLIATYYNNWKEQMENSALRTNLLTKVEEDLIKWSTSFLLPHSEKMYRFAYALQNDTLNLLHIYKTGIQELK